LRRLLQKERSPTVVTPNLRNPVERLAQPSVDTKGIEEISLGCPIPRATAGVKTNQPITFAQRGGSEASILNRKDPKEGAD